ncbi:retroviral-like aspartic protease family protein [Ancylothrix sp. C2]|uniref:retropepsin-like aspartic protease family protein n=1 Tax=Ancylothrix sp. D3o TaxID=2953691 RepID=UPI0021BB3061|nr:retropepsin-like aspartic protease [Ancylothrix sp. D3o]MCT7950392.1 retroviral-like aspartic protease family protein [Ancylothrix sp. D3o]
MRKIISFSVMMAAVVMGWQPAAMTQEYQGCFFVDRNGRVVSLPSLCPEAAPAPIPTTNNSTKTGVFQVPIKRRDGGIPVIDVTFNGKQKFEMLLDTGASITKITEAMANSLGVVADGKIRAQVASGDFVEFPTGRVSQINVGGAVASNVQVSIGSVPLLGQNFFGGYDVTIKKDVVELRSQ